jgi:ATP-dependent DNA helicase RecQ
MKDQVEALNAKGIPAACINSTQTEKQNRAVLESLVPSLYSSNASTGTSSKRTSVDLGGAESQMPTPVLLYITPESIQTERMRTVLKRLFDEDRLALFAVDEAHCLST